MSDTTDRKHAADQSQPLVKPFAYADSERMLRQRTNSYVIADGWTIVWVGNGWMVYFKGIEAHFRLAVGSGSATQETQTWSTFERAWDWVADLTPWQLQMITQNSVQSV